MSARDLLAPVACMLALSGLGFGASMEQPRAGHVAALRAGSAPVDVVTLVCPSVTGTAAGLVTTMSVADLGGALPGGAAPVSVTALPLTGAGRRFSLDPQPVATLRKTTPYAAVAVTAKGPGAAQIVVDQVGLQSQGLGRAATDSPCLAPSGDWWFAGADGRVGYDAALLLTNPTDTLANVAVTAWSATGPLRVAGLDALTVAPHSLLGLKVASFAPNAANVAVHVHVVSGSVVASLSQRRTYGIHPGGSDWTPPAMAPATSFVVAGLPAGAGNRHLSLANPGSRDATVGVRVMTRTGNFEPAGSHSIIVPAGRTVDVDLSAAIADEPAAIVGTSDQPVVAEGRMTAHARAQYDDIAWLPALPPMSGPAGLAANDPPFGQDVYLVLAAPRDAARVRIASASGGSAVVAVPAGRTVQVDPRALLHLTGAPVGALAIVPLGPAPVYATRVLYAKGTHGPLITSEAPQVLPAAIVLPPVVEDPRAGTR